MASLVMVLHVHFTFNIVIKWLPRELRVCLITNGTYIHTSHLHTQTVLSACSDSESN